LKRIIYFLYSKFYKIYFTRKFKKQLTKVSSEIYIFDIDNTIANTWPSFLQEYETLEDRLSSLAIFYNMRNYIIELKNNGQDILFLTARPYSSYNLTFQWLESIGLIKDEDCLFLVSKPNEKIQLLKSIKNKKIFFYDDMTYNHEKGEIKYYEKEIKKVNSLAHIKHFDVEKINKIIEGKHE